MNHYVNIVMEKQTLVEGLNKSIFPDHCILESTHGSTIIQIPLHRELTESESDEFAERLQSYMFEQGYDDFDIEITTNEDVDIIEETYDGDDFFIEYGTMWYNEDILDEAKYHGRSVPLGKPMRSKSGPKKFHVFVKDPKTSNIKKVNFGDPNMTIKKSNPDRRRSFRARHNCDNPGPRTKARFWSCRNW